MTAKLAFFLALPALAFSQTALTSWTRSSDPGTGMVARDIAVARSERMRDAVAVLHAIAKIQKISSDQANRSITVEANAREAGLAEWLIGELDNASPSPYGRGYVMPHDSDDATVVVGDVRLGAPVSGGTARAATLADLQEMINAIRLLGDISRTEVYAPTSVLVWRGKVWQNDFALWLLHELASPSAVNWATPVSHRLDKVSANVRIFYFAPETTVQDLGEIVKTIRSKGPVLRVVAINPERAIALRGTDTEATAGERVVAAARR